MKIVELSALEILDSRGRPTVQVSCTLAGGASGTGSVPSGASTGRAEALELRDGDPKRYRGLGCRQAVANVNEVLAEALTGQSFEHQEALDKAIIALDGSENKRRLGANALLGISLAFAKAAAQEQRVPLYQYFASMMGQTPRALPRPMVNLFSGGKHAGGQVVIQDVLVIPQNCATMDEALSRVYELYQTAVDMSAARYQVRHLTADEGGLAPPFAHEEAMLADALGVVERAGFQPAKDVTLALDVAASHFFSSEGYKLGQQVLSGSEMVSQLLDWLKRYPIISVEDGLAEEDWTHWQALQARLPEHVLCVGDDLLCTHPERISKAIALKAANCLLLKVNQIGTFSEALEAFQLATKAGWKVIVSARSGETEDDWLADLAVGWGGDYIKVGSINQSERLAKYNRLLAIEQQAGLVIKSDAV